MIFTNFEAGGKTYKLALSSQNLVLLEKKIGKNPLMIFGINGDEIPTFTTMASIVFYALQKYQHGISESDTFEILDAWFDDGHAMTELLPVIVEVFQNSGLMPKEKDSKDEKGKNA